MAHSRKRYCRSQHSWCTGRRANVHAFGADMYMHVYVQRLLVYNAYHHHSPLPLQVRFHLHLLDDEDDEQGAMKR